MNEELEAQAFEYVMGTLRGAERDNFEKKLVDDTQLQECVHFWEEKLVTMNEVEPELRPEPAVWDAISSELNRTPERQPEERSFSWMWRWMLPLSLSVFLAMGFLFNTYQNAEPPGYVAVLTDSQGQALLTAMTVETGSVITLKWEDQIADSEGEDFQLWASSKRDQQVRSLLVLSKSRDAKLTLSEAQWRLIQDAASLILTKEEKGGSPINEPSENVLAQGPCIRFSNIKSRSST